MVTPYEQPHLDLPANVNTRFTITPRNDSSFQQRVADIKGLPKTFLLFLNKLKTITMSVHPHNGLAETTSYSTTESGPTLETIVKTTSNASSVFREEHNFHVARSRIDDLPEDLARPKISTAKVVLAFPVDDDCEPIEIQQYTYAYLPMRNLGFKVSLNS
jgi:hypothetical protein